MLLNLFVKTTCAGRAHLLSRMMVLIYMIQCNSVRLPIKYLTHLLHAINRVI